MQYLSVVNLAKYQHYSKRTPPWVKLHRETMTDYTSRTLPVPTRFLFCMLWLIASENGNRIPYDMKWLSARIGMSVTSSILSPLIQTNLLTLESSVSVSVSPLSLTENSTSLADCTQDASTPLARLNGHACALPEDFQPNDRAKELAKGQGQNVLALLAAFKDHHAAKGTLFKDWQAAFRTWLRNDVKFKEARR